jgi:hypothetical protein
MKLPPNKRLSSLPPRDPQRQRPILPFRLHRQIKKRTTHPLRSHPVRHFRKRNPLRPKSKNIPIRQLLSRDSRTLHLQSNLLLVLPLLLRQRFLQAARKRRLVSRHCHRPSVLARANKCPRRVKPQSHSCSRTTQRPKYHSTESVLTCNLRHRRHLLAAACAATSLMLEVKVDFKSRSPIVFSL